MISTGTIMAQVCDKYGALDKVGLDKLDDLLIEPLDHVRNLDKHLARLFKTILMSETAGFPVDELRRVKIFRKSVRGHHQIAQTLTTFDQANPNSRNLTYAGITKWVTDQLPPILSMAGSIASSAFVVLPVKNHSEQPEWQSMTQAQLQGAYVALDEKHKRLQNSHKRQTKKQKVRPDREKRRQQDAVTSSEPVQLTADECDHYCHVHGYRNSHASSQCKVMAGDKTKFSAAKRNAQNPHQPSGVSTAVKGQAQPITALGYMVSADDTSSDSDSQDDDAQQSSTVNPQGPDVFMVSSEQTSPMRNPTLNTPDPQYVQDYVAQVRVNIARALATTSWMHPGFS
jgi:hypothetical protein